MTRLRRLTVLATVLVLVAAFTCVAQAQAAEGSRRGPRRGFGRGSLLAMLRLEQVQKEMKLNEEQTAKVNELVEKMKGEKIKFEMERARR